MKIRARRVVMSVHDPPLIYQKLALRSTVDEMGML